MIWYEASPSPPAVSSVRKDVNCVFPWQTRIRTKKIEQFEYNGYKITNFEMESSALAGLARLQGHKATTVCMVIANRVAKEANTGYKNKN